MMPNEKIAGVRKGQDGRGKSVEDKKSRKRIRWEKKADSGDEYIIGAEDVSEIMVWQSEMLSRRG